LVNTTRWLPRCARPNFRIASCNERMREVKELLAGRGQCGSEALVYHVSDERSESRAKCWARYLNRHPRGWRPDFRCYTSPRFLPVDCPYY
jgi:hypothetical protein